MNNNNNNNDNYYSNNNFNDYNSNGNYYSNNNYNNYDINSRSFSNTQSQEDNYSSQFYSDNSSSSDAVQENKRINSYGKDTIKKYNAKTKKSAYAVAVFVLWLISTLGVGVYSVLIYHGWITAPLFMQLIVGFYVYIVSSNEKCFRNIVIFFFCSAAALYGLYYLSVLFPAPFDAMSSKWHIHIMEQLFFVCGFLLISISLRFRNDYMENCTVPVNAVCVKINEKSIPGYRGVSAKGYAPVFVFRYNGKTYRVEDNDYVAHSKPKLEKEYKIFIDPDDPKHFYEPKKYRAIKNRSIFTGCFLIVLGLVATYVTTLMAMGIM